MEEHKIDLTIKKKVENYYVNEDKHDMISPEQGMIILDKYTTATKIRKMREDIDGTWKNIDEKLQPLHLFKKQK